ncbi:MAG: YlxR family protein [Clostridia bacterium]|nr:YlxR family protein [Clostridia bacterium]
MMIKKVPNRKCIVCGEMKEKHELIRVVKTASGEISVDIGGKTNGRGCYVCKNETCICAARKGKRIERSFAMSIPEEVYNTLEKVIQR